MINIFPYDQNSHNFLTPPPPFVRTKSTFLVRSHVNTVIIQLTEGMIGIWTDIQFGYFGVIL